MRNVIKHKSNCKFCEEATILSPDGKKVIAHYKCAIDNEDMSYGCKPGLCNYPIPWKMEYSNDEK